MLGSRLFKIFLTPLWWLLVFNTQRCVLYIEMISCVALMIQSYLVTEDENEKINSGTEVFHLLLTLLDCSVLGTSHNGVTFATIEVLEVSYGILIIFTIDLINIKRIYRFILLSRYRYNISCHVTPDHILLSR